MGLVQGQVMKAGARQEPANLKELDDFALTAIADRTNKVQDSVKVVFVPGNLSLSSFS